MPDVVSIIGSGAIGSAVISYLESSSHYRLGNILTRKSGANDPRSFFAVPTDIVVEAAGSAALLKYGPQILQHSELWTVSASALADPVFYELMSTTAAEHGNRLRLFSDWIALADHCVPGFSASIHLRAARPRLASEPGIQFTGSLREAARIFPDEVNSAVAAALCGPGLDNATIELACSISEHFVSAEIETGYSRASSRVDFTSRAGDAVHPTAAAIISALERRMRHIRYG